MQNENSTETTTILPTPTKKESIWDVVRFGIIALLIVIPIRTWVAQPFIVSGTSMVPTFHDGEYLIVDELSYHVGEPARGDVVIFHYPKDTTKYFIKRVIGLPNETVEVKGDTTIVIKNNEHPDGFTLSEPYVTNVMHNQIAQTKVLGPDEYYVMGDNRPASSDSRIWGSVKKDLIVGRAFLRLFPIKEISALPGSYDGY